MSFTLQTVKFQSSDGTSTCTGRIYVPNGKQIRGVVQLSHGMVDHTGRYEALAEALCREGYVFAGNDHLGHGLTAKESGAPYGYFADDNGRELLLRDLHRMNKLLRDRFGMLPVLMGHSMGSFLSRLYVLKYPHTVSGHIIHGTGGPLGVALPLGIGLVNTIIFFRGTKYRSTFIKNLAFAGYNSHYPKEEGSRAWLTRALDLVADREQNEFTNFTFTVSAYRELFRMVGESNCAAWFKSYPQALRTLVVSGSEDPVGNYGKGPTYVYKQLLLANVTDVSLKLYEGARHELFSESNRDEVFRDLISWLGGEG